MVLVPGDTKLNLTVGSKGHDGESSSRHEGTLDGLNALHKNSPRVLPFSRGAAFFSSHATWPLPLE